MKIIKNRRINEDNHPVGFNWGWSKWVNIVEKRKELVAPFMMRVDTSVLEGTYNHNLDKVCDEYSGSGIREKMSSHEFRSLLKKMIPVHLVSDIFSLFYNKSENQEYSAVNNSNRGKFKLLTGVNDSALKIITNGNNTYSSMFAIEIAIAIIKSILDLFNNKDMKEMASFMSDVESDFEGEGNESDSEGDSRFEQLIEQLLNSNVLDRNLKEAKQQAFKQIVKLEELGINLDELVKQGKSASDVLDDIDRISKMIESININRKNLRLIIEKIINRSRSYFSLKSTTYEVPIFESDNIDDISGLEYLHPVFKNTNLGEIITSEKKYYGKLTVYLDVSGSMSEIMLVDGIRTSRLIFGKSVILTLFKMNALEAIYTFESHVHPKTPLNEIDICLIDGNGGTSINSVIKHCKETGDNSLIITDACASVSLYADNIFIVGTPGSTFSLVSDGKRLKECNQLWTFSKDGRDIVPV